MTEQESLEKFLDKKLEDIKDTLTTASTPPTDIDSGGEPASVPPDSTPSDTGVELKQLKKDMDALKREKKSREKGERSTLLKSLPENLQKKHAKASLETIKVVAETFSEKTEFVGTQARIEKRDSGTKIPKYLNRLKGDKGGEIEYYK